MSDYKVEIEGVEYEIEKPVLDLIHIISIERDQLKSSASEALYGFGGWLTSRDERTIMSAKDNASDTAERIKEFCEANNLTEPADGWDKRLVHPD